MPGTGQPPAAQSAKDQSGGTRQRLASRRRCTRLASSRRGTGAWTQAASRVRTQDRQIAPPPVTSRTRICQDVPQAGAPGGAGQAGRVRQGRQPLTSQPGAGRPGAAIPGPVQPGTASGGHVAPGQSQVGTGYRGPDDRPGSSDSDASAGSRYYAHDLGPGAEPGYSLLAVSDPAADVTSTQTWRAVEDGRATGIWTAPARPDADPASRDNPGRAQGPSRPRCSSQPRRPGRTE